MNHQSEILYSLILSDFSYPSKYPFGHILLCASLTGKNSFYCIEHHVETLERAQIDAKLGSIDFLSKPWGRDRRAEVETHLGSSCNIKDLFPHLKDHTPQQ